jgi:hypothetical protein
VIFCVLCSLFGCADWESFINQNHEHIPVGSNISFAPLLLLIFRKILLPTNPTASLVVLCLDELLKSACSDLVLSQLCRTQDMSFASLPFCFSVVFSSLSDSFVTKEVYEERPQIAGSSRPIVVCLFFALCRRFLFALFPLLLCSLVFGFATIVEEEQS